METIGVQLKGNVSRLPDGFWTNKFNQRAFLDKIAHKFSLRNPKEWGKITKYQIKDEGGAPLLNKYKNSISSTLKDVYSEIDWRSEWFINGRAKYRFWEDTANQRKFLEELSQKLRINEPHLWGKVPIEQVIRNGGSGLMQKYKYSLYEALVTIFPEIPWKSTWFRIRRNKKYWEKKENQTQFFDELAKKHQMKDIQELARLSQYHIADSGGAVLLKLFKGSIQKALKSAYPAMEWKKEWFSHHYAAHGHWDNPSNAREFLERFAKENGIRSPEDWGKVKINQVRAFRGQRLLHIHGNSLLKTLQSVFPGRSFQ